MAIHLLREAAQRSHAGMWKALCSDDDTPAHAGLRAEAALDDDRAEAAAAGTAPSAFGAKLGFSGMSAAAGA